MHNTSQPSDADMQEEMSPIKVKSKSDDVIASMQHLRAKVNPITGVKLGKRRRTDECLEETLQDLVNDQTNQKSEASNAAYLKFGVTKKQRLDLADQKWCYGFAPAARKSSLVEPSKSSFSLSPKKRDVKCTSKSVYGDN